METRGWDLIRLPHAASHATRSRLCNNACFRGPRFKDSSCGIELEDSSDIASVSNPILNEFSCWANADLPLL